MELNTCKPPQRNVKPGAPESTIYVFFSQSVPGRLLIEMLTIYNKEEITSVLITLNGRRHLQHGKRQCQTRTI